MVCDSFQAARYSELLKRLALQRQEALKVSLRLEFCHQLRGMRKRHSLLRICQEEAAKLQAFQPVSIQPGAVFLTLRCDDWKGTAPPVLKGEAQRIFVQEVTDSPPYNPQPGYEPSPFNPQPCPQPSLSTPQPCHQVKPTAC